jgi:anti-sigma-K factor RskA
MDTVDHAEFAELLAVYSLDALPPEEASELEGHLADCPRCRAELEALRDVAALLGNSGVSAPAGTWDRIANELGTSAGAQAAPPLLAFQSRRRPPLWRNAAVAVAAVVLAVLGLLSYRMVNLDHRVGQLQDALGQHGVGQLVALALADPAHRSIELTEKTSPGRAQVVVLPDGTAYWVGDDLGGLPAGKTYQLWALASGKVVSIGILGRAPRDVPFRVEPTMTELMVTAEPAGGTPAPTTSVLVQGALEV